MTDEETAAVFIKRYFGTYTEAFRSEMIPPLAKLIKDEREACAREAIQRMAEIKKIYLSANPEPGSRDYNEGMDRLSEANHIRSLISSRAK